MAPFNEKAAQSSEIELCYVCGRKLGKNPIYFEVINGGELREQNGSPAVRDAGYMGCFPVGSECKKKFAPNVAIIKMGAKWDQLVINNLLKVLSS